MKQILSVIGALAVPVISKLVIPESVPLNIQITMLISYFLVISTILAGIFYLRNTDLTQRIIEIRQENIDKINDIRSQYNSDISDLKKINSDLEINREALKDIISNNKDENIKLRALLALYAYTIPEEQRHNLEQAASLHIGGQSYDSESD